jgi:hypothetical protein
LALGWDVVRIQRGLLASARANATALQKLDADYGGAASWLEDTKRSLKWVPGSAFQEHHAEDEVSYNARRTADLAKDTADAASAVGEYVAALATILRARADEDAKVAGTSLKLSGLGLGLICFGFLFQAHSSVLQLCHAAQNGICSWLL